MPVDVAYVVAVIGDMLTEVAGTNNIAAEVAKAGK
jgi:hypothetical protein